MQDPLPCHELGCLFYRAGDYETAKIWLRKSYQQMPKPLTAGTSAHCTDDGSLHSSTSPDRKSGACKTSLIELLSWHSRLTGLGSTVCDLTCHE